MKKDALANRANDSAVTVQCDAAGEEGRSTSAQAIDHITERGLRAQSGGSPDRIALAEFMSRWRQLRIKRNEVLGASIFRDPGFDMLLELFATDQLGHAISVTSLCHASGVPMATAHRHLKQLEKHGLVVREGDRHDIRRCFVRPTDKAIAGLQVIFDQWREAWTHLIDRQGDSHA